MIIFFLNYFLFYHVYPLKFMNKLSIIIFYFEIIYNHLLLFTWERRHFNNKEDIACWHDNNLLFWEFISSILDISSYLL